MPNYLLGYQGALYIALTEVFDGRPGDTPSPSETFQTVTWTLFENVTDVDGNFDSDKVDITTRAEAALGWASEISTTKKGEVTFTMRWKPGDTVFETIRDAWLAGTELALLDLDQPIATNGAQGLASNFSVSLAQKKPVKGLQTAEVKLTISSYPSWVVSNGSTLSAV